MEYNEETYPKDSAVQKWNELIMESTLKFGRAADMATGYKQQLIEAGFENVTEVLYKWPQNTWPKDPKMKEIGKSLIASASFLHFSLCNPRIKRGAVSHLVLVLMEQTGAWHAENFTTGLSGLSMAAFTRGLGWTAEELEVFLVDVRKSMKDTKIHGYYPM